MVFNQAGLAPTFDAGRFLQGFGWGIVATAAMTLAMVLGLVTGITPMPAPVPVAIIRTLLGMEAAQAIVLLLAIVSHFIYGGVWGGFLAVLIRPVSVWAGLGLGIFLWLIMQVIVLPFVGWGFFGSAITPAIAVATLVLHLIYGATLGWLLE